MATDRPNRDYCIIPYSLKISMVSTSLINSWVPRVNSQIFSKLTDINHFATITDLYVTVYSQWLLFKQADEKGCALKMFRTVITHLPIQVLNWRCGTDLKPPFILVYINREGSRISRPISDHDLINELCLKTADS